MLAANIDDMTGEAFGYLMERLMAEGALDVSFVPLTMKKSRPGLMAQVVARVEDEEKLGNLLLKKRPDFDPRNYGFSKLSKMIKSLDRFEVDVRQVGDNNTDIYVRDKQGKDK